MRDEDKLLQLWINLLPNRVKDNKNIDWEDIGFSCSDPTKDFRGVGILGLDLLLKITNSNSKKFYAKALEIHKDSINPRHWFFFA